jgi:radical SAM superfamily enzyme YgiQ (UPF0313 family)
MTKAPFILLVNPWITDFAAHDLWAKPMGLLVLATLLREGGCGVALVDCLNRHDSFSNNSPELVAGKDGPFGTGKYCKAYIPKPEVYADVPRRYHRYGIHPDSLTRRLGDLPTPNLIWVTSHMTYWYPGVFETIRCLKNIFPSVPIWLGGIYATLCRAHADVFSGAHRVISGTMERLPAELETATGFRLANAPSWGFTNLCLSPALDLLPGPTYAPILTGLGCPYRCPYCASSVLQPMRFKRSSQVIYEEIIRWHQALGVSDFAFYDDALLLKADTTLKPALEQIVREGLSLRFHTPNAVHIRVLTREWCDLLFAAGFKTIRLGLETMRRDRQVEWGGKVDSEMFGRGVKNLLSAGFQSEDIGVYLMAGLPGQTVEEVRESIQLVHAAGAQPYISEYSPVPGTALWVEACRVSPFDLEAEPLTHNNTFLACRREDFTLADLESLKASALQARRRRTPQ